MVDMKKAAALALAVAALPMASAQTFQRLGTCPTLGCVLPPDQQGMHTTGTNNCAIRRGGD